MRLVGEGRRVIGAAVGLVRRAAVHLPDIADVHLNPALRSGMPIGPVPNTTVTSALQLGDRNGTSGADAAGLLNEACAAGLTCRKTSMRTRWMDRRGCLLDQVADGAAQAGVFAGERLRLGAAVHTHNSMAAGSPAFVDEYGEYER